MDRKPLIFAVGALFIVLASFALGFYRGRATAPIKMVEKPVEHVVTETATKTDIQYIPKPTPAAADIAVTIPKQELTVSVNGKEHTIQKSDNEKYVFDKGQLKLEQTSKASLDISIPTVDKTRRWSIGIGVGKDGAVYMVRGPLKGHIGVWAAGDKQTVMGGVSFDF